jgi:hypothetical protein
LEADIEAEARASYGDNGEWKIAKGRMKGDAHAVTRRNKSPGRKIPANFRAGTRSKLEAARVMRE